MTRVVRGFEGELALYVKDLGSGVRYTMNAATPMYLASAIKVTVLVTLFRQAERGELDLDKSVTVSELDLRDGSPLSGTEVVGKSFTLRQLAREMMVHSDNLATDLLIGQIGLESINAWLASTYPEFSPITSMLEVRRQVYGRLDARLAELSPQQVRQVRSLRSLSSRARLLSSLAHKPRSPWTSRDLQAAWAAYYADGLNSAPMETVGALLEALARGELLSPAYSAEALGIMRECATGKDRLRRFLPEEVEIAHKTGTQQRRACNVGILSHDGQQIVVALCTKEHSTLGSAERAMAEIGRAIYETITAEQAEQSKAHLPPVTHAPGTSPPSSTPAPKAGPPPAPQAPKSSPPPAPETSAPR